MTQMFAEFVLPAIDIFYKDDLVFAFVNLRFYSSLIRRPSVPGHVLISPNRVVAKYFDLTNEEVIQMWIAARKVGKIIGEFYGTKNVVYAFQEGPEAGQTVKHVHMHIIPEYTSLGSQIIDDIYRQDRTDEQRKYEAEKYRSLLESN